MRLIRSKTERDDETGEPLFWSNEDGWVDLESADWFDGDYSLPIGGEWVKFLSSVYGAVTDKGQGTAYRFVAEADSHRILGIEYQDFETDKDFVDDSDLEELSEEGWRDEAFNESRRDECFAAVAEYIKTTDRPIIAYGMTYDDLDNWGKEIVD